MLSGGFDVVSMMFALHYSFESEELARGMLKNVSGALKKGGRFIGVMPNSDVISATVKRLLQTEAPGATPAGGSVSATPMLNGANDEEKQDDGNGDDWDPEKPSEANGDAAEDDWDPQKPSEPIPAAANGLTQKADDEDDGDWDPEKPSEDTPPASGNAAPTQQAALASANPAPSPTPANVDPSLPPLEWGNGIYTVRFPRSQPLPQRPLPRDGIFRPPYGWKYHYSIAEAVNAPEYVVPWEGFRALAEDYGLELLYRKGFREVFEDESGDRQLGMLAERMGVMSRDRSDGRGGLLVSEEEMEAAAFYHAFCFYKV
ncbi:mRNA cap guanine-N7 methyltransferase [Teratosphaeriaceae sp. CCFEE 6253]|nr:mRNA cap guanine-N7 methyltransferase [Teratosphaeriaceae sp. CCFEE 6253]